MILHSTADWRTAEHVLLRALIAEWRKVGYGVTNRGKEPVLDHFIAFHNVSMALTSLLGDDKHKEIDENGLPTRAWSIDENKYVFASLRADGTIFMHSGWRFYVAETVPAELAAMKTCTLAERQTRGPKRWSHCSR